MRILALDQATVTGWAVVEDTGMVVDSGIWRLADTKEPANRAECGTSGSRAEICHAIQKFRPDMICHEQTLLRGGAATEIANGLKARSSRPRRRTAWKSPVFIRRN